MNVLYTKYTSDFKVPSDDFLSPVIFVVVIWA